MSKRVITFGTFDVLHYGHIRILERAREMGDYLIVGVSSDELNYNKKNKNPIYSYLERKYLIGSCKFVDEVFREDSLEQKREYIEKFKADILVMGDDWAGKFDYLNDICNVVYLPRTPEISTTEIIYKIRGN